jgi:hypothetical protein
MTKQNHDASKDLEKEKLQKWADGLTACMKTLKKQRDEARALARVLAHAYEHDSRPPLHVVQEALSFPIISQSDE